MRRKHPLLNVEGEATTTPPPTTPIATYGGWRLLCVAVSATIGAATGTSATLFLQSQHTPHLPPPIAEASQQPPAVNNDSSHQYAELIKRLNGVDKKLKQHREAIVSTAEVSENLARILDDANLPGWPARRVDFTDVNSNLDE